MAAFHLAVCLLPDYLRLLTVDILKEVGVLWVPSWLLPCAAITVINVPLDETVFDSVNNAGSSSTGGSWLHSLIRPLLVVLANELPDFHFKLVIDFLDGAHQASDDW